MQVRVFAWETPVKNMTNKKRQNENSESPILKRRRRIDEAKIPKIESDEELMPKRRVRKLYDLEEKEEKDSKPVEKTKIEPNVIEKEFEVKRRVKKLQIEPKIKKELPTKKNFVQNSKKLDTGKKSTKSKEDEDFVHKRSKKVILDDDENFTKPIKKEPQDDFVENKITVEIDQKIKAKPKKREPVAKKSKKVISDDDDDDEPKKKEPIKRKKKISSNDNEKPKRAKRKSDSDEEKPTKKPKLEPTKQDIKNEAKQKRLLEKQRKKEEEELKDFQYKWWLEEDPLKPKQVKWSTMKHNGVLFPPEYVPHKIPLIIDNEEVELVPHVEEVATFFAAIVGTDYEQNEVFCENFFVDFKEVAKKHQPTLQMESFKSLNFQKIHNHLQEEKEKRKNLTKEQKDAIKKEKEEIDEKYGWALIDDRKEKVGNFRIEPPGLFRGRGAHPKTGKLKLRIVPEQVTINSFPIEDAPLPPEGHKWKDVVCVNNSAWLAYWNENINGSYKYVLFAPNSSLKTMSDFKKFETARELKKHVLKIRKEYTKMLKDEKMGNRQMATAMYFIDKLALRAGNKKGEDEADTVGCCSLRYEHVVLSPQNKVCFDFLGKDSIRYLNEVTVSPQVHKNIMIFKKDKQKGDSLFDRLSSTKLNSHLKSQMEGLTAKVFRTYNASITFQQELDKTVDSDSIADKILAYNRANREVAVLCNHQRAIPKSHKESMLKMQEKKMIMLYERNECKEALLSLGSKKKYENDEINLELIKKYLDEKEEVKKPLTEEQLEKKYASLTLKINNFSSKIIDRDENKTTALGTSKLNYLDPRITVSWCKKHDVPVERLFPKLMQKKFKWAMEADKNWTF